MNGTPGLGQQSQSRLFFLTKTTRERGLLCSALLVCTITKQEFIELSPFSFFYANLQFFLSLTGGYCTYDKHAASAQPVTFVLFFGGRGRREGGGFCLNKKVLFFSRKCFRKSVNFHISNPLSPLLSKKGLFQSRQKRGSQTS